MVATSSSQSVDFKAHWAVCALMLLLLLAYNVFCLLWADDIRWHLDEPKRVLLRSIAYALAIALFPLTNLLRHILLRLNQTMPGQKSASRRYLTTIIVAQLLLHGVASFGALLYWLGDDRNTLFIFTGLGVLAVFLHKPKTAEYWAIVESLAAKSQQ